MASSSALSKVRIIGQAFNCLSTVIRPFGLCLCYYRQWVNQPEQQSPKGFVILRNQEVAVSVRSIRSAAEENASRHLAIFGDGGTGC